MKLFTRGDVDGFCAIALDNIVQLLLVPALCLNVVGLPASLVYGRILPGIAVSYLVGNLFYAWQAHRLAKRENRSDVCALPFGLNTPTFIAYVFLVMLPAKQIAIAQGAPNPDEVAWQAGLVACIGSGCIEFFGAFISERIRRMTPRAALLAALSGAGMAFLTLNFLLNTFAHPIVGLITLGLVLLFYFGRVKPKFGVPAALVVLAVGTALSWLTGLAPQGALPQGTFGLYPPVPVFGALWQAMSGGHVLPYLSVIIPMGLLNLLASLQCIESAAAAGDSYSARSSLMVNGLGTFAAACFGSPFPTSIYIGHPAWKRMGARAGYSTLNGIFITVLCATGSMAYVAWAVPADAGIAIIIWIGLIICVQAFEVTPQRHWPAVVLGTTPVIIAWAMFFTKNALRIGSSGTTPGIEFSPKLVDAFHASGTFIDGGFALEQGAFYCALVLSAVTVLIIERRLLAAAGWALAAAVLSLLGLLHAWRFAAGDTVSALPLLDFLTDTRRPGETLFPAAGYAIGYAGIALALAGAHWFTEPGELTELKGEG
ncbi:SulP family inorganic anion transporter [Horticoccus sp. 23ND18S-11]|uniref:NCS2 family permease n=1 Tax=Horticoccus sp. 23ND18S-11 TaxID=3391832 RepID=UPI0039C9EA87